MLGWGCCVWGGGGLSHRLPPARLPALRHAGRYLLAKLFFFCYAIGFGLTIIASRKQ